MLSLSDLKPGVFFVADGDPWQVLESTFVKMAQRTGHVEAKIRNLRTGNVLTRSFKQSDRVEEAEISRARVDFIYTHRNKYVFTFPEDIKKRFELDAEHLGDNRWYLVPELQVHALMFDDQILGIELPPKVDLKVTEATPWIKGDTASGGTKTVTVETGLTVKVPHFITQNSVVRVNTKTGEYVERVEK